MKTWVFASLFVVSVSEAQFPKLNDPKLIDAAKGAAEKVSAACKNESVQFCKEKQMDKLKACLVANYAKLSDGCKAALKP